MTWQRKPLLGLAALALLSSCAGPLAPAPSTQFSAADLRSAEDHSYWSGYAAGRRYQKQQDAQLAAAAPDTPVPAQAAVQAVPLAQAAVPVPAQPAAPADDNYAAKGPAKPVATPVN